MSGSHSSEMYSRFQGELSLAAWRKGKGRGGQAVATRCRSDAAKLCLPALRLAQVEVDLLQAGAAVLVGALAREEGDVAVDLLAHASERACREERGSEYCVSPRVCREGGEGMRGQREAARRRGVAGGYGNGQPRQRQEGGAWERRRGRGGGCERAAAALAADTVRGEELREEAGDTRVGAGARRRSLEHLVDARAVGGVAALCPVLHLGRVEPAAVVDDAQPPARQVDQYDELGRPAAAGEKLLQRVER